jgi:hypothetical protein
MSTSILPSLSGKTYAKKYERRFVGNILRVKKAEEFLLCCFKMQDFDVLCLFLQSYNFRVIPLWHTNMI